MFQSCYNRGFKMKFQNGWTVSVQFGTGNYCERQDYSKGIDSDCAAPLVISHDAEIAVWRGKLDMIRIGNDHVAGHVSADQAARVIAYVQTLGAHDCPNAASRQLTDMLKT